MYCLKTDHGYICYTGDFIIDPLMKGSYDMDLGKVAYVGKQGVLCLLSESAFSEHVGHTSPSHRLKDFFKDQINRYDGRIIFSVLPTHLYTIDDIFKAAEGSHRKIVIMGKKLQSFIKFSHENGYLDYPDDIIGDLSNVEDKNAILLVCDDKSNAYGSIAKIANGYDKYIVLKENDTIIFAEPRYDENEKTIVKLQNDLAMAGAHVVNIPSSNNILHHASKEDLMIMIKLINPKYYMPVKGEYRHMVNNANLALDLGMPSENIILKQNGDVALIKDGVLDGNSFEHIDAGEALIDGNSSDDIGELVIKDREMLSESGIVLVTATISKEDKTIISGPDITTKGFIYVKESKDIITGMKEISKDVIESSVSPSGIDFNRIKTEIRTELSNYLYEQTECKPMIIAVVQEV